MPFDDRHGIALRHYACQSHLTLLGRRAEAPSALWIAKHLRVEGGANPGLNSCARCEDQRNSLSRSETTENVLGEFRALACRRLWRLRLLTAYSQATEVPHSFARQCGHSVQAGGGPVANVLLRPPVVR